MCGCSQKLKTADNGQKWVVWCKSGVEWVVGHENDDEELLFDENGIENA